MFDVARDRPVPRRSSFRWIVGDRGPFVAGRFRTIRPGAVGDVMANPFEYVQQVRTEATKVSWPSRKETLITTGMVLAMVVLAAIFFVTVDQIVHFSVGLILGLGR